MVPIQTLVPHRCASAAAPPPALHHLPASYCACCLSWLAFPVYGPVMSLGPVVDIPDRAQTPPPPPPLTTAAATSASPAALHSVSEMVWAEGKAYASTGTALPSSHCAVTAAMLVGVLRARVRVLGPGNQRVATVAACLFAAYVSLIWFSVVFCGFHYVSDVIAGLLLAFLITWPLSCPSASCAVPLSGSEDLASRGPLRTRCLDSVAGAVGVGAREQDRDDVPLLPIFSSSAHL